MWPSCPQAKYYPCNCLGVPAGIAGGGRLTDSSVEGASMGEVVGVGCWYGRLSSSQPSSLLPSLLWLAFSRHLYPLRVCLQYILLRLPFQIQNDLQSLEVSVFQLLFSYLS